MANKPWLDSDGLIEAVKRKISVPINQRTFTDEIILSFANEEMMINQVPDILQYHEEYFVAYEDVPLVENQLNYPIPERALGARLRDVWYKDTNGNLYEMTRINPDDKAYWQNNFTNSNQIKKYYLQDTDVVLATQSLTSVSGSLQFSYYRRPGLLTTTDRSATSESFVKSITVNNSSLTAGDTVVIGDLTFTAVSGSPSSLQFQIGASSIESATNLATAITSNGTYTADNGSPATAIVSVHYDELDLVFSTSDTSAFSISSNIGIQFSQDLPSNITNGVRIDFLQTKPGHKTLGMSFKLPANSVSTDTITLSPSQIPEKFVVGDYICEEYECIIPQIPADLHSGLAERICNRILASMSDEVGLAINEAKLQKINKAEGTLLDNRVEGSCQKVNQRKSLLNFMRMGYRRRF